MRLLRISTFGLLAVFAVADKAKDPWEYTYEDINEDLSYGAHQKVWDQDDHTHIPGWTLGGEGGYLPHLLDDRVIMTDPDYGGRRSSIWSDHDEPSSEWVVDFEFKADGPKKGDGNMQIWYAKDGQNTVKTSSIYTVGKFEGLAIVISQYGGKGGSIRGFYNDGKTSMKDHHHVDRLAFGQCDFPYRNLGHFTHIHMRNTKDLFELEVNHHPCFKTHKVNLPAGFRFGTTAASADRPDSFESKAFIVSHDHNDEAWNNHVNKPPQSTLGGNPEFGKMDGANPHPNSEWYWTPEGEKIADAAASQFKGESERFQDLHDRMQLANHQLDALFHDLSALKQFHEEWNAQLKEAMAKMESMVTEIKKDVEDKDYRRHLELLANAVQEGHDQVMRGNAYAIHGIAQAAGPRIWFFAFIVFAMQAMLGASYLVYKKRLENQPKKFL